MRLEDLRRMAVAQTLFPPTSLARALEKLGFVQADPIRAPARAQDLVLRHRVRGYREGDLERRYGGLRIAEDFFVNYGFVSHSLQALMHPRPDVTVPAGGGKRWSAEQVRRARGILRFVRARGAVHPREVDERFAHGTVTNYWGGSSNATTHLLDQMHYRGLLRVVRRERGIRIYAAHEHARVALDEASLRQRLDALVDAVARVYAPFPAPSLAFYVRRLRFAVPQWAVEVGAALARARERLARARVGDVDWYWPQQSTRAPDAEERVRFLAPFDPVVHDRWRFERLWGWVYRFEAYTPVARRKLGYYALPLLWRDRVVGWANLASEGAAVEPRLGFVAGHAPRERAFRRELDAEVDRVRAFLR